MPADGPDIAGPVPVVLPSGLRHDLLNALNAVLGFATLLESDLPEGEHRRWADRLLTAAREAQALAERIPSTRSRQKGCRILLVAADAEGDAMELALDREGWDMVRVFSREEAERLVAMARDDIDAVLAVSMYAAPAGRADMPILVYNRGEPVSSVAERLRAALGGAPRG